MFGAAPSPPLPRFARMETLFVRKAAKVLHEDQ
jgi:hypothetical protein